MLAKISKFRLTFGDFLVFILALVSLSLAFVLAYRAVRGALGTSGMRFVEIITPFSRSRIPLREGKSRILKVRGKLGYTIIEINGTKVRFVDSPCPRKLCVKKGWVKKVGESVVCMPNEVSAIIVSFDVSFDENGRRRSEKATGKRIEQNIDALTY